MVELPAHLERSTLGDVLGALHRAGVSGALSLECGLHRHVLHWREGLIHEVESSLETTPAACPPLAAFVRRRAALERLFALPRARLRFRARGARQAERPLLPADFLHGRPRKREQPDERRQPERHDSSARGAALRRLGFAASDRPRPEELRSALRDLARRWHPDRHPGAGPRTREALHQHFSASVAAYERLTRPRRSRP